MEDYDKTEATPENDQPDLHFFHLYVTCGFEKYDVRQRLRRANFDKWSNEAESLR